MFVKEVYFRLYWIYVFVYMFVFDWGGGVIEILYVVIFM